GAHPRGWFARRNPAFPSRSVHPAADRSCARARPGRTARAEGVAQAASRPGLATRFRSPSASLEPAKGRNWMRRLRLLPALVVVSLVGMAGGCTASERVIEHSSVVIAHADQFTSFNPQTSFGDRDFNNAIRALTSSGFSYYNDVPELVRDESFG